MEWEPFGNQEILQGDGFYISYRNDTAVSGIPPDYVGDYGGCDETALVNETHGRYFILNGDFRQQYSEVFLFGWDACLAVYREHEDRHASSWSMKDNLFGSVDTQPEWFTEREDDCDDDEFH